MRVSVEGSGAVPRLLRRAEIGTLGETLDGRKAPQLEGGGDGRPAAERVWLRGDSWGGWTAWTGSGKVEHDDSYSGDLGVSDASRVEHPCSSNRTPISGLLGRARLTSSSDEPDPGSKGIKRLNLGILDWRPAILRGAEGTTGWEGEANGVVWSGEGGGLECGRFGLRAGGFLIVG